MSAICLVVARDRRPVDTDALDRLFDAAPHRGRFRDRRIDPTAVVGCQNASAMRPHAAVDRLGSATIAFHGRIHNRAELVQLLSPRWPEAAADDDARLVLRAFLQWGEACASRLVGDFAFVVCDPSRRLTYGARDAMGVKPLYYFLSDRQFIAATELSQLVAAEIPLAPCEPMIAELLAFDVRSRRETLYRDIYRLPPGHWMRLTEDEIHVAEYWRPDPVSELRYARDEDYADHFFDLLRTAVADRAPGDEPCAAYLSGGLDSSSVVCMARALERSFETFSLVFPDVPEADERQYIEAVATRVGAPSHLLANAPIDAGDYRRRAAWRADLPELPSDAIGEPLLAAMRERGHRIALTGVGGDFGFAGSLLHYADLLQQGDLAGLLRQYRSDRETPDVGSSPRQLVSQGLRLLVPAALRKTARPIVRRLGWGTRVPSHIDRRFAARTGLLERFDARRSAPGPAAPTRRYVSELFASGWTCRLLETIERAAADYGLELRHPFYDRRLVEFAVAIPESQRWRGRTTKFVMRQAMRPLLPETVYARMGKADASALVPGAVEVLGGEAALNDLHIGGRLGWIDTAAIAETYRRARRQFEQGTDGYCGAMFSVWVTLAVDAWYRSMFVEDSSHERLREQREDPPRRSSGRPTTRRRHPEAIQIAGTR